MRLGRSRGATLIELAVATFLFLIILGLTSNALSSGVKSYLGMQTEIELQQDAVVLLSKITREIGEANALATWPPPVAETVLEPPGGMPRGVVFSSPRDELGKLQLDEDSRQPIWQKRLCYIFNPGERRLYRSEDPLDTPTDIPPGLDPDKTTAWFHSNRPQDPLPAQVQDFIIEVGSDTDVFNLNIRLSTTGQGKTTTIQFRGHSTMRG